MYILAGMMLFVGFYLLFDLIATLWMEYHKK